MADTQLLLLSALAFLSLLWLLLPFKKRTSPPLPPGPIAFPLLGNLLSLEPELHTYFARLAQSYGPIYRFMLGTKIGIVITSPSLAKQILKDNDITFANRDIPAAARETAYGGVDIAWNPYGPEWRLLRKICVQEMLSNKTMDSIYALRRREIRQAVNHVYSRSGSPVDVGEQMFLVVMNVVTSMLWGGTVEGEDRESIGSEFKKVVGEITAFLGMPNFSDFYPFLKRFDIQGIQRNTRKLVLKFDQIFDAMIDRRSSMKDSGDKIKDFLQFLLQLKDDDTSKTPLTITQLKALLIDMIVGGTDTTANTLEFALAEMMNKPEVLKKAQQELDSVVGKDNIVEETHISKLPYLYCVMKETLRLHPILPLLIPHCPSANCTISGYTVPKGSRVFINVWAIHRDPSIWENPLEFVPERFADGKWDFSGNEFNYFPFGSGRRICAGIPMAERMFMHSLASLVHSFEWSVATGKQLDLSEEFGIVLKKRVPLVLVPTPRLSDPKLYD